LAGATLLLQLASTNLGVSAKGFMPDLKRFNPMSKLKQLGRQNAPSALQALIILAIMMYVFYSIAQENLAGFLMLPYLGVRESFGYITKAVNSLLWKMAFVLVVFGAAEMLRHRWMHYKDLRMSRQEIRDEHKEQEGDPHIKSRIRRLRRDLLRRQMMRDVATATTVIVNPTHYAVAIRYDASTMACPKVVAKGRNYLALRIRERAREHDVPVVENPPLARALYSAVEVGRDIPQEFYKAIAEVLAYIYRTMGHNMPGAAAGNR
jgi:flagellar biosynthetic protein FlhB